MNTEAMPQSTAENQYQLKLKEGDFIQVTVTSISQSKVNIDTSRWANVKTAVFTEIETNPSPGSQLYAKVTSLDSGTANLVHERGVYKRNHLPGDSLTVQGVENVSTSLCKANLEETRNLNRLYVAGIAAGTEATVELVKIRGSTAIALPKTIHADGITPGQRVTVQTTAGSQQANLSAIGDTNDQTSLSQLTIEIKLANPACVTGTAEAYITELNGNTAIAAINSYPVDLPEPQEKYNTTVKKGHDGTTVQIGNSDTEIRVQFDHPLPITGRILLEISHRDQGIYHGNLRKYTSPPISTGNSFEGLIYASQNKGRIEYNDRDFTVVVINGVSTSGTATLRIVEISDEIKAEVVGEIEEVSFEDAETTSVDMTNLSKL